MEFPADYSPAAFELKKLIQESAQPLTEIARAADVRYEPLWKWVTGRQKAYGLLDAERVYFVITGRTFLGA